MAGRCNLENPRRCLTGPSGPARYGPTDAASAEAMMSHRDPFRFLKRLDSTHALTRRMPVLTWPLRLVSWLVYRLLELVLGRHHPHTRVVRQSSRLASPTPDYSRRPQVLFFTLRGWFAHVTTEAILATALSQRGAGTQFLLCGGVLDQCDFKPPSDPFVTRPLCWRCTSFAERLLDRAGQPYGQMKDYVDVESLRTGARERLDGLTREQLLAYEDDEGTPLGALVIPSVQRGLLSGVVPTDAASVEVLRGYVAAAIVVAEFCRNVLDDERPDAVVMTNGLFFAERLMFEISQRRGVRVVTYERGILPNTIIVDVDKPVVPFDVDPYWQRAASIELTNLQRSRLEELLTRRMHGDVGVQDLWPKMEANGRAILTRLGLDPQIPTDVLYTNILWDTAVFERDIAFDGLFDWVETTIRAYAEVTDRQLVVRVHPAEVRLEMRRSRERVSDRISVAFPQLPSNVAVVEAHDPASSYALMGISETVFTYTSTIGLEAALLGHNVVVAGDTHYRGRGFTTDVDDPHDYVAGILGYDSGKAPDDERLERAWRYGHCFFFDYMRAFPWVDDRSRAQRSLQIQERGDLAPGVDARLDELCDLILGHVEPPLSAVE